MGLQDMVISRTTEIIFKACKRHADKNKLELKDVHLSLGVKLKDGTENEIDIAYVMYEKFQPVLKMTYKQVLGGPDFMGTEAYAPPVIANNLMRLADQLGVNPLELKGVCVGFVKKDRKGKDEPALTIYLYQGNKYLKTITIEEFIDLGMSMDKPDSDS